MLDCVYRSVALQRIDQIHYNMFKIYFGIIVKYFWHFIVCCEIFFVSVVILSNMKKTEPCNCNKIFMVLTKPMLDVDSKDLDKDM
jgi:hypothetical protein